MARGLDKAPVWAWVVIVVGALVLAIGLPLARSRGAVPPSIAHRAAAQESAAMASSMAAQSSSAAAAARRINIAALGDSYTGGSAMDSGHQAEWPALLTAKYPWNVNPVAIGGTGFVNGESQGRNFAGRVDRIIAAKPAVVIVEGGHNDSEEPLPQVTAAARDVLTRLHQGLPQAKLIVFGVVWPGDKPPQVKAIDQALREDAAQVDATFIDADGWFSGPNRALIGADGTHPTDAGHQALAQDVAAALTGAGVPATV